jgi:biotin carboxyl carrier protein
MKLHAILSDREAEVQIRLGKSRLVAVVNDRSYELELQETGGNRFLIMHHGDVFNCRVDDRPVSGKPLHIVVGAETFAITLIDPKRLRGSANETGYGHEVAQIIAPMPGKIVRLLVDVGAKVQAGEGIVTVEAMKMQNEMKSPKAGFVVSLNAKQGATVNAGDVLAVIE